MFADKKVLIAGEGGIICAEGGFLESFFFSFSLFCVLSFGMSALVWSVIGI